MLSKPRDVIQVIVRDLICLNSSNSTLFPFAVYSAASMHALTSLYESTSDVTSHVILNKIRKIVAALDLDQWYTNLVQKDLLTQDLTPRNIEDVIFDRYL